MNKILKTVLYMVLIILLVLLLFFAYLILLIHRSKPTFSKKDLEEIVHKAVIDFRTNESLNGDPDDIKHLKAQQYFDKQITEAHLTNTGIISRENLIKAYDTECLLNFVAQRVIEKYPEDTISDGQFCYQETGGVFARARILLMSPKEYLDLWGSNLPISGFSGYYSNYLNEGDVMIMGTLKSSSPESNLSAVRTYTFGQTSELKAGDRRYYTMGDEKEESCYMLSYGLHKNSNLIKTMFPGLIIPYLFQNNDTKSFMIQSKDAMKGFKKFFIKQHKLLWSQQQ